MESELPSLEAAEAMAAEANMQMEAEAAEDFCRGEEEGCQEEEEIKTRAAAATGGRAAGREAQNVRL